MVNDNPKMGWRDSRHNLFRWVNDDCIHSLTKIQVPIIAINSDQKPTDAETIRRYVSPFEAKIIPDIGHVVMWDAREEFNRLLEESIQKFMKN